MLTRGAVSKHENCRTDPSNGSYFVTNASCEYLGFGYDGSGILDVKGRLTELPTPDPKYLD
ncbi:MAG: hypothetical protein WBE03_02675 [Terracidiphilus sp.]